MDTEPELIAVKQRRRITRGSIEARGKWWWNRARWEELLTDGTRRRRQLRMRLGTLTELRTLTAASAELDRIIALARAETLIPGERVRFDAYAARFDRLHVARFRPNSQRTYRSAIRNYLVPQFGALWLDAVTTREAQELVAAMLGREKSRATCQSVRGVLLGMLKQARAEGFAACDIDARRVKLPKVLDVEDEPRHITPAELDTLIAASSWPQRALWGLMGLGGLRVGEALALTWDHVEHLRRALCVRQSTSAGRIWPPKTKGSAGDVPLLPSLALILTEYRKVWRPNDAGLLFATKAGKPLRANDVRRRWLLPTLVRLGIPHAGFHAFRHGFPGQLHALGVSLPTIRVAMRHRRISTTQRYFHHGTEATWREIEHATTKARERA